jgi:Tol biopolymer transport system component
VINFINNAVVSYPLTDAETMTAKIVGDVSPNPHWSPDGNEIIFQKDGKILTINIWGKTLAQK